MPFFRPVIPPHYSPQSSHVSATLGFTLIEVLVALVIVGTALTVCLAAAGSMTQINQDLRSKILASWTAENRMVQIRLAREFPPFGKRAFDCPQGDLPLVCEEEVLTTPNKNFRKLEIIVHDSNNPTRRITRMVQLVPNG